MISGLLTLGLMLNVDYLAWLVDNITPNLGLIVAALTGSAVLFGVTATHTAQAIGRQLGRSRGDQPDPPEIPE